MIEPTLAFLGEQIKRIQAELRDLRGVRSHVAHLRSEIADLREDTSNRIDNVETHMDRLEFAINARFDQVHSTMATNLEVLLVAIKDKGTDA